MKHLLLPFHLAWIFCILVVAMIGMVLVGVPGLTVLNLLGKREERPSRGWHYDHPEVRS